MLLKTNSNERKSLLYFITNKGDFSHNYEVHVLEKKVGTIIPLKRPSEKTSADMYVPCPYCYGFVVKKELWKHIKSCPLIIAKSEVHSRRVVTKANILLPMNTGADKNVKVIISSMNDGDIAMIVRNYNLICKLGCKMSFKAGKNKPT